MNQANTNPIGVNNLNDGISNKILVCNYSKRYLKNLNKINNKYKG